MANQNQLEALLRQAAKQLGTSPEQLKQAAQSGKLDRIIGGMNAGDAAQFEKVLSDKDAANKLLSTPQAQKLLQMLSGQQKGGN